MHLQDVNFEHLLVMFTVIGIKKTPALLIGSTAQHSGNLSSISEGPQ